MSKVREYYKSKYKFIKDIPGVGDATTSKLREIGFHTIEALATATPKEIISAGVGEKTANKVIKAARKAVSIDFVRADELKKLRGEILHLATGSRALDDIIGGGLETQSITEFYGEFGSGKSQICQQLCVMAQLPLEEGGLGGGVLYLDTEQSFRVERVSQIAKRFGLKPEDVLKNIIYAEAFTSDHQMILLDKSDKWIKDANAKLVIVDSLTSNFRSDYVGREMLAERQQKLNRHMHKLHRLARAFNTCAVVTNQVMARPDAFFAGNIVTPIGGHIVGHTTTTRVFLRKAKGIRIARLVASPYLPEREARFKITENGIEDIAAEE